MQGISFQTSRRALLLASITTASFASGFTAFERLTRPAAPAGALPPVDLEATPLSAAPDIAAVAIEGDLLVPADTAGEPEISMQTNGYVLRIDLARDRGSIDCSRILVHVEDRGHDAAGSQTLVRRVIRATRPLFGPLGTDLAEKLGNRRLLLALSDSLFRVDETWYSRVDRIELQAGWMQGAASAVIPGGTVERRDSRAYAPFPVRPLTPPFARIVPGQPFRFELSGMHEFGQSGRMFACVQAWLHSSGVDGPVASASIMEASALSPESTAPSGLTAPVFALALDAANLPEGEAEIRYRAFPFIGPPWESTRDGIAFPALAPTSAVPVCIDRSESWSPLFGVVSQTGIGLAGTDTSGLSLSMEQAIASGRLYRDAAAVAAATRLVNRASSPVAILEGLYRRAIPHDDIAAGVAVLRPVAGSVQGQNTGAYVLRTGFSSQTQFPPGATPFEMRSESGLAHQSVRLRGVDANGVAVPAGSKSLPSRMHLRGIWIDGTGLSGTAHIALDGTAAAGAATTAIHPRNQAYLITTDCVMTENPAAGSAAPARWRCGYVWDVRLRHEGISGVQALGVSSAFNGIVMAIGCSYARPTALNGMVLSALLASRMRNVGVRDADATARARPIGRLLMNVRFDYDVAFTSPMIVLAHIHPSVGGLGISNVMCRGAISGGGPIMQISADSSLRPVDNLIMHYFSHDNISSTISNGRCNILYQDHAYTRVEKIGTIKYCAFKSYNIKGDNFQQRGTPAALSASYASSAEYARGALVHDTAGTASASSTFFQALRDVSTGAGQWAPLSDTNAWFRIGAVFSIPVGEEARRQGNACMRYAVGSAGNVAASTYNSDLPGSLSGYGFQWGQGGSVAAPFAQFYNNPIADDYRPAASGPLIGRVPAGMASLPFDLAGRLRRNDGAGAAGAYEA